MNKQSLPGKLIYDNRFFFFPFAVFVLIASILLAIMGNSAVFHFINRSYSPATDFLFLNISNLGDGMVAFLLVFILLWVSFREALTLLVITLAITILFYVLKRYFFGDFHRPVLFFGEDLVRLVPGYIPPKEHTFPSGHTATAFSVYLYLTFLARNNYLKLALLLTAILVGYSRVYLAAHFPADVVGGAVLAVAITVATFLWSRTIQNSRIDQRLILNKPWATRRQTA